MTTLTDSDSPLARLRAAQAAQAAQQPAASASSPQPLPGSPMDKTYFVLVNNVPVTKTRAEVQAMVTAGYNQPICLTGSSAWTTVDALGFQAAPPAAPPVPVAPPLAAAPPVAPPVALPPAPPVAPPVPTTPATPVTAAALTSPMPTSAEIAPPTAATAAITVPINTTLALPDVTDESSALAIFNALMPVSGEETMGAIIADASEGDGSGMSHEHPFATLRENQWFVPKDLKEHEAILPVGNRAYTAIFVSWRIGAVGWVGSGRKGVKGQPPAFRFALPNLRASKAVSPLLKSAQDICRRVQFTSKDAKVKFDGLGRLTTEVQILAWVADPTPRFIILVAPGFKTVEQTVASLTTAEEQRWILQPCSFTITEIQQVNKKVQAVDPTAANASWLDYGLTVTLDSTPNGAKLREAFTNYINRDRIAASQTMKRFLTAEDFNGLSLQEVADLLPKYDLIPA